MFTSKILSWFCDRYIPEFILVLESMNTRLRTIEKQQAEMIKLLNIEYKNFLERGK
jgi:hypothetical protein